MGAGVAAQDEQLNSVLIAVGVLVAARSRWGTCFDFVDAPAIQRTFLVRQVYVFGHLPIAVGLTAAGVRLAIIHANDDAHPSRRGWWCSVWSTVRCRP